jgi:hypothetical protein
MAHIPLGDLIDLQANIHQPWLRAWDWLCAETTPYKSKERWELADECKAFWVLLFGIVIQFETCGGTSALIGQLACRKMTFWTFLVIVWPHRLILPRNTVFIVFL